MTEVSACIGDTNVVHWLWFVYLYFSCIGEHLPQAPEDQPYEIVTARKQLLWRYVAFQLFLWRQHKYCDRNLSFSLQVCYISILLPTSLHTQLSSLEFLQLKGEQEERRMKG